MKADCVGSLMDAAMENIRQMVEVNTIIGDAVETKDGTVIIPVSRMCCGFASGGTHFMLPKEQQEAEDRQQQPPFGGGAGAGVSVQPVGFLLVGTNDIRFQVVDHRAVYDRLIDEVPKILDKIKETCTHKDNISDLSETVLKKAIENGL